MSDTNVERIEIKIDTMHRDITSISERLATLEALQGKYQETMDRFLDHNWSPLIRKIAENDRRIEELQQVQAETKGYNKAAMATGGVGASAGLVALLEMMSRFFSE
jgi:DNA repair exonuclease SbcCD ATPase subunit